MLLLFAVEAGRSRHRNNDHHVASAAALKMWHTFVPQGKDRARLSASRDFELLAGAAHGGESHFCAQGSLRNLDRDFEPEVIAVAPEVLVGLDVNDNIQIA